MKIKRKYVFIIIGVIILLSALGTFAWFEWASDLSAQIFAKGCAPEVVFLGGTTINGTGIRPVSSYDKGLRKDINVNLQNLCDNDTATMTLKMELELFPEALADSSFKWALYKGETSLGSGNFANKVQGETITLADQQVITGNVSTYTLYIYLDGNMDNPSSTQNQNFRFKLYGEGRDAIYNEYTMKAVSNTSATASFWGSSINANQVKSITFTNKNSKPNTVDGQLDVSSIADSGDVIMWWIENGQTDDETPITLYDVYVGSESGTVKANTSANKMFAYLTNCESMDLYYLDTSNVTDMSFMFRNCYGLTTLDLSSFNTSNVMTMKQMFLNCSSLTSLDISSFDTTNVNSLYAMFANCSSLTTLDMSSFDTTNITTMMGMFSNCSSLISLDFSNINTSELTTTKQMFQNCSSLESVNLSGWNNPKLSDMSNMFYGCSSLVDVKLSSFNTSSVTNFGSLFWDCTSLITLDLSSFNTLNAEYMTFMFNGCSSLTSLDLSNFRTPNITKLYFMFNGCSSLTSLDLSNFDTSKVNSMTCMFNGCSSLTSLDLSNFTTPILDDMQEMFRGCTNLTSVDMSNFTFSNLTKATDAFTETSSNISIIVKDCTQYNLFKNKIGNKSGLHTVNNDTCTA